VEERQGEGERRGSRGPAHRKLVPKSKGKVRYRCAVDAGPGPVTGKRKQVTRTFGTLREAKAEHASILHRRHEAARAPLGRVTVDERLDQRLSTKAEDLEESTAYSCTMTLAHVRGRLGHVRLQDLTEDHVEAWMRWALQEGRVRGGKTGTAWGRPRSRWRWLGWRRRLTGR
jgi:predicted transcriptional regulator